MQQIRLNTPVIVGLDASGQPVCTRALVARIAKLSDISPTTGATIIMQVGYISRANPTAPDNGFWVPQVSEFSVTFAPGPDLDALVKAASSVGGVFAAVLAVLAGGTLTAPQLAGTVETVNE